MRKPGCLDTTGLTHVGSQTVLQAQGLGKSRPDGVPELRREGTQGPIPNPESPPTGDSAQWENYFSPRGSHQAHKPHLSSDPCPAARGPHKGTQRNFGGFLFFYLPVVYLDLVFVCFFLQVFCLYVVVSDFVFIGFLFVRMRVSVSLSVS